jgi:outer membrane protein assembly factor BamD
MKNLVASMLLLTLLGGFGCSTTPVDENDPKSLMKDAEEEISSDHYQIAVEKLKVIKNKFPYSKQATEAHLRIADVYFLQDSFAEAAAVYESFRDLHPKHEKTAYAMFRLAKSYFNDIPSPISRDLTPATRAMDAYLDFTRRYPLAPENEEAKKDIAEIRNLLAEKEVYVADFYFKRGFYDSAKPRYKKVLELYPETRVAKQAEEQLAEIAKRSNRGNSDGNKQDNVKPDSGSIQ